MHWEIELIGEDTDLQMLANVLEDGDVYIQQLNDEFLIRIKALDELSSANEVRERATEIAKLISGSTRILLGSRQPVTVGNLYQVKADGTRAQFVTLPTATLGLRAVPPTVQISRSGGSTQTYKPGDPIRHWIPIATTDKAVDKALRLRDERQLGWVELYRILEVVIGDVGQSVVAKEGWVSKKSISRFEHTANSVTAAGDKSRHGKESTKPPKNPMKLSEARTLIDHLLTAWIEYKVAGGRLREQIQPTES